MLGSRRVLGDDDRKRPATVGREGGKWTPGFNAITDEGGAFSHSAPLSGSSRASGSVCMSVSLTHSSCASAETLEKLFLSLKVCVSRQQHLFSERRANEHRLCQVFSASFCPPSSPFAKGSNSSQLDHPASPSANAVLHMCTLRWRRCPCRSHRESNLSSARSALRGQDTE